MADLTEALKEAVDTTAPVIDEGTILRIDVTVEDGESERTYTYVALYVAHRWYLTGRGSLLGREYVSTAALLTGLSPFEFTMSLATEFDTIR